MYVSACLYISTAFCNCCASVVLQVTPISLLQVFQSVMPLRLYEKHDLAETLSNLCFGVLGVPQVDVMLAATAPSC